MKFPPFVLLIIATLLWGGNFVIGRAVTGEIPLYPSILEMVSCLSCVSSNLL